MHSRKFISLIKPISGKVVGCKGGLVIIMLVLKKSRYEQKCQSIVPDPGVDKRLVLKGYHGI